MRRSILATSWILRRRRQEQEDVGTDMNVQPVVLECVVCVAGLETGRLMRLISRLLSWTI